MKSLWGGIHKHWATAEVRVLLQSFFLKKCKLILSWFFFHYFVAAAGLWAKSVLVFGRTWRRPPSRPGPPPSPRCCSAWEIGCGGRWIRRRRSRSSGSRTGSPRSDRKKITSCLEKDELRNECTQEKMWLKIWWITGSSLQADFWFPKTSGYPRMPGKVSKPRKQCLDHFFTQQRALKSQGCGKSGVKFWMLSWRANDVTTCVPTCAFKHLFSHEPVLLNSNSPRIPVCTPPPWSQPKRGWSASSSSVGNKSHICIPPTPTNGFVMLSFGQIWTIESVLKNIYRQK